MMVVAPERVTQQWARLCMYRWEDSRQQKQKEAPLQKKNPIAKLNPCPMKPFFERRQPMQIAMSEMLGERVGCVVRVVLSINRGRLGLHDTTWMLWVWLCARAWEVPGLCGSQPLKVVKSDFPRCCTTQYLPKHTSALTLDAGCSQRNGQGG